MQCNTCLQTLPPTSFEKTPSGNPRGKCKDCRKRDVKETKEANKRKAKELTESGEYPPPPTACIRKDCQAPRLVFEKRTEVCGWRNICSHCINRESGKYARQYASRAARAKVDPEYAKKRQDVFKRWRVNNPEKVKENTARHHIKRCTDPAVKMKSLLSSARQRKIDVVEDDMENMKAKLNDPCFYCGKPPDVELSTLDRVDSDQGYSDKNTVPSCKHCNNLKGTLPLDLFVHKLRKIHGRIPSDMLGCNLFEQEASTSKFGKPRSSGKKDKSLDISVADATDLWFSACTYCGIFPSFSIDRVDSDKNYTKENVAPCCTICNKMKKDMSVEELYFRVAKIVENTKHWVPRDFRDATWTDAGRPKKFLRVDSGNGRSVIFPSNRLLLGHKSLLLKGTPATPREFWEQDVTGEDCLGALERRLDGPL